jgi:fimbrial chaperone protein
MYPSVISHKKGLFSRTTKKRHGRCLLVFTILPASGAFSAAHAYTITPAIQSFGTSGNSTVRFFTLINDSEKITPVELSVRRHSRDENGKTVKGALAEDDFLIYPAQAVLMPQDRISIQVRWMGPSDIATEQVYALDVKEVPLPEDGQEEDASGEGVRFQFKVLINYEVRLYVTPKGAEASMEVVSAGPAPAGGSKAAPALQVVCANKGSKRQSLKEARLVLTSPAAPSSKVVLDKVRMPELGGTVYAGGTRKFTVPWPDGLPVGPVSADIVVPGEGR